MQRNKFCDGKKAFSCNLRASFRFFAAHENASDNLQILYPRQQTSVCGSLEEAVKQRDFRSCSKKRATFLISPDPLLLFNCAFVFFWMQENRDFRSSSTKKPNSANCCPHTSDADVVLQDSACVNTGAPPAGKQRRVCVVMIE